MILLKGNIFIFLMFTILKHIYIEYPQGGNCFYMHLGYKKLHKTIFLKLSVVEDIKYVY